MTNRRSFFKNIVGAFVAVALDLQMTTKPSFEAEYAKFLEYMSKIWESEVRKALDSYCLYSHKTRGLQKWIDLTMNKTTDKNLLLL